MKSTTIILTESELRDFVFQNFSKNESFKEHKSYIQFNNVKKKINLLNESPPAPKSSVSPFAKKAPTFNYKITKAGTDDEFYNKNSDSATAIKRADDIDVFLNKNLSIISSTNTDNWVNKLTKIRGKSNNKEVKLGMSSSDDALTREERVKALMTTRFNETHVGAWDPDASCFDWVMDGADEEDFGATSEDILSDDMKATIKNKGFNLQEVLDAISMLNLLYQFLGRFLTKELPVIGWVDDAASVASAANRWRYIQFLDEQIEKIEKQGTVKETIGKSSIAGEEKDLVMELNEVDVGILKEEQTLNYIFFVLDALSIIPFAGMFCDMLKKNMKFGRMTNFFKGKSLGEKAINFIRYVDEAGNVINKTVYKLNGSKLIKAYKELKNAIPRGTLENISLTSPEFLDFAKNFPDHAKTIEDAIKHNPISYKGISEGLEKLFKEGFNKESQAFLDLQDEFSEVSHMQGWMDWFKNRDAYDQMAANAMKDVMVENAKAAVKTQLILSLGDEALKSFDMAALGKLSEKGFHEIIETVIPEFTKTDKTTFEAFVKKVTPILGIASDEAKKILDTAETDQVTMLNTLRKELIEVFENSNQLPSPEEFYGVTTKIGNKALDSFTGVTNVTSKGPQLKYYDATDVGKAQHALDKFLFDNADNLAAQSINNLNKLATKTGTDISKLDPNLVSDYNEIIGQMAKNKTISNAGDIQNFLFSKIRGNYINKIRKLTSIASDLDSAGNPKIGAEMINLLKNGLDGFLGGDNSKQALQFFAKLSNGAIVVEDIAESAKKAEDVFQVILKSLNHQCAVAEYVLSPGSMNAAKVTEMFTNAKIVNDVASGSTSMSFVSGDKMFSSETVKKLNFGRGKSILGVFDDESIVQIPQFLEKTFKATNTAVNDYASFQKAYEIAAPKFTTLFELVNQSTANLQVVNSIIGEIDMAKLSSMPALQNTTHLKNFKNIFTGLNSTINNAMETLNASTAGESALNLLQDLHTVSMKGGSAAKMTKINNFSGASADVNFTNLLEILTSDQGQRVTKVVGDMHRFKNVIADFKRISGRTLLDFVKDTLTTLFSKLGSNFGNFEKATARSINDIGKMIDVPIETVIQNPAAAKKGYEKLGDFLSKLFNVFEGGWNGTYKATTEVFQDAKGITKILAVTCRAIAALIDVFFPIRFLLQHPHLFFVVYNMVKYALVFATTVKMGIAVSIISLLTSVLHGLLQGATFKLMIGILSNAKKIGFKSLVIDTLTNTNNLLLKCYKMYRKWKEKTQNELERNGPILELDDIQNQGEQGAMNSTLVKWFVGSDENMDTFANNMLQAWQMQEKKWNIDPEFADDSPENRGNIKGAKFAKNLKGTDNAKRFTFSQFQSTLASRIQNQFDGFVNSFTNVLENRTGAINNFDVNEQANKIKNNLNTAKNPTAFLNSLKFEYMTANAFSELDKAFNNFKNNLIQKDDKGNIVDAKISNRLYTILFYFYTQQQFKEENFDLLSLYDTYIISKKRHGSISSEAPTAKINNFISKIGMDINNMTEDDKLIFTTFFWNMTKNKAFLMNIRKDANMQNKPGYLNLDAMLSGGLYGVKFETSDKKEIILTNLARDERYAPIKKLVTFKSDHGGEVKREMYVPYLRDVSDNGEGSKLFQEIFLSQYQSKNKSNTISWDPFDISLEAFKKAKDFFNLIVTKFLFNTGSGLDLTDLNTALMSQDSKELINENFGRRRYKLSKDGINNQRQLNELFGFFEDKKENKPEPEKTQTQQNVGNKNYYSMLGQLQQHEDTISNAVYSNNRVLSKKDSDDIRKEKMDTFKTSLVNNKYYQSFITDTQKYKNYKVQELIHKPGIIASLIQGFKSSVQEIKPLLTAVLYSPPLLPLKIMSQVLPGDFNNRIDNFVGILEKTAQKFDNNFAKKADTRLQLLNKSPEEMKKLGLSDKIIDATQKIKQGGVYNADYRPVEPDKMKTIKKIVSNPEKVSAKTKFVTLKDKSNELLFYLSKNKYKEDTVDTDLQGSIKSGFSYALVDYLNVVINSVVKEINSDAAILMEKLSEEDFTLTYPKSVKYKQNGIVVRHYPLNFNGTALPSNAASQNLQSYYNEIYERLLKSEYTQGNEKIDQVKLKEVFNEYHQFIQSMFNQNENYSSDKILSKNDKIVGFYEDADSFKKWAEDFKQNNNIDDPLDPSHDMFKNMKNIFDNSVIINKLIFMSNYGLDELAKNTNNENFKQLNYLYEVDITYLYEKALTGQKLLSNPASEIRSYECFIGFPFLCKECFTMQKQDIKLNIISPETEKEETFDFSFFYYSPNQYVFKNFKRVKFTHDLVKGQYNIKTIAQINLKDFLKQDK